MTQVQVSHLAAKRNASPLFNPLTFSVGPGEYVEITGPNGSGKTTLLRVLAGLYDQFNGEFQCEPVMYYGHRLGLDPLLNAAENLTWLAQLEDQRLTQQEIVASLKRMGVAQFGLQPVAQLSQGQQRRVRMAQWRLSRASVWLLDEPLNALDSGGRNQVAELIDEHLAAGGSVICATHLHVEVSGATHSVALEGAGD